MTVETPEARPDNDQAYAVPATALEPFATIPVILVAAALFLLEMAFSDRYGFHRDELYFLDAARHLQGGYVDQPVLVPLLARISLTAFGVSLVALRVWSALAVAATVVVAGLLARELGGGRRAQVVAAIAVATMPAILAAGDILETSTLDALFWSALALVVIRVGRTGDSRYWLAGGVILGLGLANKHSIGFFAAAIILGAILSGGWRLFFNRWALAGGIIAVCFTIPDLAWQAMHDWPTISMTQTLNQENGGAGKVIKWVLGQVLMVNIALIWVWIVGLRFLWKSDRPLWRALVWAYTILFVLFAATTGAKIYYLAAAYVYLLAAGAVSLGNWWAAHRIRSGLVAVVTALVTVLILPLALPVLPPRDIGGVGSVNTVLEEEIGWPQLVHTVANVWFSLPTRQRANAVIFTGNYGEAGAINELGRADRLPIAVSGHNNEWFCGPGNPNATTVVAVAPGPLDETNAQAIASLSPFFRHIRVAATLRNPYGLHNQEWGGHIYVCTGLRHSWGSMWPELRQYS